MSASVKMAKISVMIMLET